MSCRGEHHFFVCEVIGVEALGEVRPILACTSCGEVQAPTIKVAPPNTSLRMLKEEKEKQKENIQ